MIVQLIKRCGFVPFLLFSFSPSLEDIVISGARALSLRPKRNWREHVGRDREQRKRPSRGAWRYEIWCYSCYSWVITRVLHHRGYWESMIAAESVMNCLR